MLIGVSLSYPNFALLRKAIQVVYDDPSADISEDVERLYDRLPEKIVDTISEDVIRYMEQSGADDYEIEQARIDSQVEITREHIRNVIVSQAEHFHDDRMPAEMFHDLCEQVMPLPVLMRNRVTSVEAAIPAGIEFERITVRQIASALRQGAKRALVTDFSWNNAVDLLAALEEPLADGSISERLILIPFSGVLPSPITDRSVRISFDFEGDDAFAAAAGMTYSEQAHYL